MGRVLLFAGMLAFMPFAQAVEYTRVNTTASQIAFNYSVMGNSVYGRFATFEASLDFDPDNLATAHAKLIIQLASIDAGSPETNSQLQEPAWFNTADYPVAVFEAVSTKALGDNHYEVTGKLSLKGQTRDITLHMELKPGNDIGVFDGDFLLNRSDFKIGEGEWASSSVVSDDINIKFRIVAPAH
ncbi:MAG: YceI family protein [Pseudomonas sp.]|nr:YceI family protein [Pseudomonas sp.]